MHCTNHILHVMAAVTQALTLVATHVCNVTSSAAVSPACR